MLSNTLRRLSVLIAAAFFTLASAPTWAQANPSAISGVSEKTAEREQALAALDDADPIQRIGSLEAILQGSDSVLINFAMKKVLAGSDNDMKGVIIRRALSETEAPIIVQISQCRSSYSNGGDCQGLLNAFGDAIAITFSSFDQNANTFVVISPAAKLRYGSSPFNIYVGKLIDDRILFELDLNSMYGSNGFTNCVGDFSLSQKGTMDGSFTCGPYALDGSFSLY